jgi:hypothetical protein
VVAEFFYFARILFAKEQLKEYDFCVGIVKNDYETYAKITRFATIAYYSVYSLRIDRPLRNEGPD